MLLSRPICGEDGFGLIRFDGRRPERGLPGIQPQRLPVHGEFHLGLARRPTGEGDEALAGLLVHGGEHIGVVGRGQERRLSQQRKAAAKKQEAQLTQQVVDLEARIQQANAALDKAIEKLQLLVNGTQVSNIPSLSIPEARPEDKPPPNPATVKQSLGELLLYRAEMAANVCCINVEPGCRQGHDAHLALEAQAEKVSAAMQARRAT